MALKNNYKIVTDPNILLSYLIGKKLKKLENLFIQDNIEFILSDNLIKELTTKITLPKFRKYFEVDKAMAFIVFLKARSLSISVHSEIKICRDPKDNYLLGLAKDGKADYLITGDNDLLALKEFEHTKIVTFSEFTGLQINK